MAKFASGAMLLPSLVQVSESISGSVVPLAMFMRINLQSLDSGHNDEALMIRSGWWHNAFSILFSYFFLSPKFR